MNQPVFLIVNVHAHGHFLVYSNNLTLWALSRGYAVVYAGSDAGDTFYHRKFAGHSGVRILDLMEYMPPSAEDLSDPVFLQRHVAVHTEACLRGLHLLLRPAVTVLVHCDELFFDLECPEPGTLSFDAPTYGILTFGHREYYLGAWEPYTLRLHKLLTGGRNPFMGLFTMDEYHAASRDPDGERLFFMPDMYRELDPLAPHELDGTDTRSLANLREFLGSGVESVVPIIGKFDRRKNPLWILRMVVEDATLSCVVMGQRVPDPEQDLEIDVLLARLEREGRLWLRFGFVPEALFTEVARCPRVRFMPLPYSCHFGSSGVQLMAYEHGLPVLTAGQGLMAMRIEDHGLGLNFSPGDESAFREAFRTLNAQGRELYMDRLARFMANFSRESLFACFDRAFAGCGPDSEPAVSGRRKSPDLVALAAARKPSRLHRAMHLAMEGRLEEAVGYLEASDSRQCFLLGALNLRLGRHGEAQACFSRCLTLGMRDEVGFFILLQMDLAKLWLKWGDRERSLRQERVLSTLLWGAHLPARNVNDSRTLAKVLEGGMARVLYAEGWQRMGAVQAALGCYRNGALSFRLSLFRDPLAHDVRLNLSDILRYDKRYRESWAVLDEMEAQVPDWHGIHHKRGQVLFEQGRFDEAKTYFELEPESSRYRATAQAYLVMIARAGGPAGRS